MTSNFNLEFPHSLGRQPILAGIAVLRNRQLQCPELRRVLLLFELALVALGKIREMQECGMALRSTIFKVALDISDIDRGYYQSHALTVARHPSETDERMMVRVLAFALNVSQAKELLEFGKGLSSDDEPALWERDLTGNISHWIEVGLPDERVLRRACGRADRVTHYAYGNGRTIEMWWQQHCVLLAKQTKLSVFAVSSTSSKALAAMAERTLDLQCMIQEDVVWMSDANSRFEVQIETLQASSGAN